MEFVDEIRSVQLAHLRLFYMTASARDTFFGVGRVVKERGGILALCKWTSL